MLFVCILGWEQQKLFRILIWEPFPWIIFQEMLTIPLVFRELQNQHHKWHLCLYLCLQRFLVLHVCLSWCALGGKDVPNIVNQMATKKCLFTKCMEELDKVRSQRCSYAVSRRRCFLFLHFFSILFPFSPFLLASLLFSLFPSFCNSLLHYCTLLNLLFPFSLFSSFCLLSLLSSFSSLFSPLIPSSTLLCLLIGPLSFPSLYALFFLPSSFSSLLYPFSFSPSFISFLFFSPFSSSPLLSLSFHLWWLALSSRQARTQPLTHSLSRKQKRGWKTHR